MFPSYCFPFPVLCPECLLNVKLKGSMGHQYDLHPNNFSTFNLGTEAMGTISIEVELT